MNSLYSSNNLDNSISEREPTIFEKPIISVFIIAVDINFHSLKSLV